MKCFRKLNRFPTFYLSSFKKHIFKKMLLAVVATCKFVIFLQLTQYWIHFCMGTAGKPSSYQRVEEHPTPTMDHHIKYVNKPPSSRKYNIHPPSNLSSPTKNMPSSTFQNSIPSLVPHSLSSPKKGKKFSQICLSKIFLLVLPWNISIKSF